MIRASILAVVALLLCGGNFHAQACSQESAAAVKPAPFVTAMSTDLSSAKKRHKKPKTSGDNGGGSSGTTTGSPASSSPSGY